MARNAVASILGSPANFSGRTGGRLKYEGRPAAATPLSVIARAHAQSGIAPKIDSSSRRCLRLPPHAAALRRLGLGVDGDGQAIERAVEGRQHAPLDEIEGRAWPAARAR